MAIFMIPILAAPAIGLTAAPVDAANPHTQLAATMMFSNSAIE
jgi:hypothetical protein